MFQDILFGAIIIIGIGGMFILDQLWEDKNFKHKNK
jgi:hypothetical protein